MSTFLIVLLLFFGSILILLEVFFLPGFVVGLVGFVICAYASIEAFQQFGTGIGLMVVGATVGINLILAYFGLKNLHKSPMAMKEVISGRVNEFHDFGLKAGDTGKTLTALRPEGKAVFGDQHLTVWAFSGFIESGQSIEVVRVADNKIFVTQLNQ